MKLDYKTAKENFLASDFEGCRKFFTENNCTLELAYYELVNDNLKNSKELFEKIKDEDIRAKWGLYLISMIELNVRTYPTYLELRNFLEIDLNILINNFKGDYVQNIIRYCDFMNKINPEVYKFCGRVFYNNGFLNEGMALLLMAKDAFYQDPELHYLLACAYLDKGDRNLALHYTQTCQEVLPEYFPAVDLNKKLQSVASL